MIDGYETVRIASADGALAAEFVPEANMLCHSLTYRDAALLPPGRGVRIYAEQGKTMGIPLLYPWANRLAGDTYEAAGRRVTLPPADGRYELDPNGLPRHGAMPKLMRWQLSGDSGGDRVSARLAWDQPALLELFPYPHSVGYEARLTESELRIELTVRADAGSAVPVSFGFHPFLRPADVPRGEWQVELGATERMVLDDLLIPTGRSEPLSDRSFTLGDMSWDDGLGGLAEPPAFSVAAGGRRLTVTFLERFSVAQVYAPPGQDLIAFEPMTAPTNALVDGRGLTVVEPGGEYRAAFALTVADN